MFVGERADTKETKSHLTKVGGTEGRGGVLAHRPTRGKVFAGKKHAEKKGSELLPIREEKKGGVKSWTDEHWARGRYVGPLHLGNLCSGRSGARCLGERG